MRFTIAYLLYYVAEYKKAESLYEKGMQICRQVLGEDHPNTGTSYNNLAVVYFRQRDNKKALSYYLKAYIVFVNKFGSNHPNARVAYENMEMIFVEWKPDGDFKQWLKEKMKE